MKTYPSISGEIVGHPIYAFDKLDGSNIRAEWSRKNGFYKFGTRKRLLGPDEHLLGRSIPLIMDTYSDDLEKVFRKQRWDKVVAFFEFYGPNSFAGWHDENEEQSVKLIDINVHKKGLLEPKDFLKTFKNIEHAELLYHGNPNENFIQDVKEGNIPGMTFEGVVCKGKHVSPGLPLMFKVKNIAWIKKLKEVCGDDEAKFEKLL